MQNNNIDILGAGSNFKKAAEIKYVTIKNKIIAFINVAENEWSTTRGEQPGANPINEISQYYQIKAAKESSDFLVVIPHGGHENYGLPSPRMKQLYRYFIDLGADAVVGHHTHCFSGHEKYKNKPVIYSLGNFIFDRDNPEYEEWNTGCAVNLKFNDNSIGFDLIPFHQCSIKPGVTLFNKKKKKDFIQEAAEKRRIIKDDGQLQVYFDEFTDEKENMYYSYLEPIKNRYLLAAMNKGVLPRLIRNNQRRLLLNLVRTEAHRDVLLNLLSRGE